jgi:uncharacterized protein YuzE
MTEPRLSYDPQARALYLRLSENDVAETLELSRSAYLDVDAEGTPVSFEILNADPSLLAGLANLPEGTTLIDVLRRNAA